MQTLDHDSFFIGGTQRRTDSGEYFDVISPRSEERIGRVPAAARGDIDAAVASAREAFDRGPWQRMSPAERGDYCAALAEAIQKRADALAPLISEESGCSINMSRLYQAVSPALSLNYSAELSRSLVTEESRVTDLSRLAGTSSGADVVPMLNKSLVLREAVGVVAIFPAYNFALPAIGQKLGPALVAGCTVVIKATEPNPLAIMEFGELLQEIGLPAGVVNIVAARVPESEYLVRHPGVDLVSFTGSVQTGKRIGEICGALVRPVVLELGGKSAAIVLDDAVPDNIIPTLVSASVGMNSGQSCAAQSRILVPTTRYAEYAEAIADTFASLKVGDPMDPESDITPLITSAHREQVESHIARAREEGATVKTGGRRPPHLDRGWYIEPTLLTDVHNSMYVAQHESFGPVVELIAHNGEADAIAIANDSAYGLSGSVFTSDVQTGVSVARQVRTGTFSVNTFAIDLASPFGGVKESGIGREHGPTAVEEFLVSKTISLPPSGPSPSEIAPTAFVGVGPGISESITD